jgi:hypothetical protein
MDVAAWLHGLGLEQYALAFRDNDVDGEVLPELTADDLNSIGVTSVGHRRKLLAAIAALRSELPTVAQSAARATSDATSHPAADAERRQLTMMFRDLVGSTALSTRHDPEDLRELIGDYHRAVAETVGRFDGFVAKYMGDGVLRHSALRPRDLTETSGLSRRARPSPPLTSACCRQRRPGLVMIQSGVSFREIARVNRVFR